MGVASPSMDLEEVNKMGYAEFISAFRGVFEHGALAAATVWGAGPFPSSAALHEAFLRFLQRLDPEAKKGVVRCYPDLAGKLAGEGALTEESLSEHKAAGLLELSEEERAELVALNDRYKEKFGFPFVICARENKKDSILRGIKSRLGNSVSEEVENALAEIGKISRLRIANIVQSKL